MAFRRQINAPTGPLAVLVALAVVTSLGMVAIGTAAAAVPDDNGRIAFVRDFDLWIMDTGGGGERLISVVPNEIHQGPAWSSDGELLAFSFFRGGSDIWVMPGSGGAATAVTSGATQNAWPTWSPQGDRIAYESVREVPTGTGLEGDILITTIDGSSTVNVTQSPMVVEERPAWSPDGATLAFCTVVAVEENGNERLVRDVWTVPGAGGSPTNLTDNTAVSQCDPSWSPDGDWIAFAADGDIWAMRPDGSNKTRLTTGAEASEPAWSPDGLRIAYSSTKGILNPSDDTGLAAIWVMEADGTGATQLTDGTAWDRSPAWQPLPGVHHVGLVDPDQGRWHLRDQGTVRSFFYGNPGDVPFLGDWDCDGEDTPGLYRRADGFVYLRNSNTQGIADVRFFFGNPGDLPLAGDFDGDGCDTVSLYRPSEGRVFAIDELGSEDEGLGAAEIDYLFGNPGDQPFTGDFDGDGVDTVGLHRASTGLVYFRNSHTQGIADVSFVFGDPGDRFVAGDWTDDGADTAGLFRPSTTTFFFRNTNTQGIADAALRWGEADWLPVAGDFSLTGPSRAAVGVDVFFGTPGSAECDDVAAVTRTVEPPAVLAEAMKELLEGPTGAETAAGYTSWFSAATAGMLNRVTLDAGTARVDFRDFSGIIPNASTSCGSAALLAALDATATQFATVGRAVYSFDGDAAAFYNWLQRDAPPGF